MPAMPDALSAEIVARDMRARVVGRRVVYFESVDSTNDLAAELAERGEPEGTVVIADEQIRGRGRMGRAWIAPKASSVLMSVVLRPSIEHAAQIGMAVGLGACDAIEQATGLKPQLKWPNDILLNGKKCAGILVEVKTLGEEIEYAVAGLGVNVNFRAAEAEGIPRDATTIADELGKLMPRARLVKEILRGIDDYYARLRAGADLRGEWKQRLVNLGRRVRAWTASRIEEGIAEDVDGEGALLLRRDDGSLARLIAGDVTLSVNR